MIEWIWIPLVIAFLVGALLLDARISSRFQVGWLRPPHKTRIQEEIPSSLELAVIAWIKGFYTANATLPTYQTIMERSKEIDPDGVGIDLATAMACYKTAKTGLESVSEESYK